MLFLVRIVTLFILQNKLILQFFSCKIICPTQQKILFAHLKELTKAFTAFYISPHSWDIWAEREELPINDMDVTSDVGSRNIYLLTSNDQNKPETRSYLLFDVTHWVKIVSNGLIPLVTSRNELKNLYKTFDVWDQISQESSKI